MKPTSVLISVGIGLLVLDLVVLRMILRKRMGHWLLTAAGLCLAGAVVLMFLLPARHAL